MLTAHCRTPPGILTSASYFLPEYRNLYRMEFSGVHIQTQYCGHLMPVLKHINTYILKKGLICIFKLTECKSGLQYFWSVNIFYFVPNYYNWISCVYSNTKNLSCQYILYIFHICLVWLSVPLLKFQATDKNSIVVVRNENSSFHVSTYVR